MYAKNMKHNAIVKANVDIQVGNVVRVLLGKKKFGKKGMRYSKEVYAVADIDGAKYKLMSKDVR